jgi:hypothetical protein
VGQPCSLVLRHGPRQGPGPGDGLSSGLDCLHAQPVVLSGWAPTGAHVHMKKPFGLLLGDTDR